MKNLILVAFSFFLDLSFANAEVTCAANCRIFGERFHFSFNRINRATYLEGMERCLRIPATTEIISVPQGSATEMACFSYVEESENLTATDASRWLAENELRKQCERHSKNIGRYEWVRGELKNVSCR
ncbi:MAG: hypothetical protein SGJ18_01125 [Pseudomonadota bacterium]|nr:hypothetical protein [Pseudomonadota bacterium]